MRSKTIGPVLLVALCGAAAAAAPPPKKAPSFLEDPSPVIAAFKAKIPAPFLVTELTLSPTSATIEVQDTRQKDTYDEYNYNTTSGMSAPEPQQVFSVTCKKGFSIDEADYSQVPVMMKDAVSRLNLEDGKADSINLSRGVFCKEPRWMIFVKGERKDGSVEYDPKGKFRNSKIM